MGILAKIFGAGDVVKAGFDLIDDLHTSDEEAIAATTKAKTDLLSAYAPFKIAQRVLAFMFTAVFLLCFAAVMTMTLMDMTEVQDVRAVMAEFWLGEIMALIVGFYFGGGAFEGFTRARNEGKK